MTSDGCRQLGHAAPLRGGKNKIPLGLRSASPLGAEQRAVRGALKGASAPKAAGGPSPVPCSPSCPAASPQVQGVFLPPLLFSWWPFAAGQCYRPALCCPQGHRLSHCSTKQVSFLVQVSHSYQRSVKKGPKVKVGSGWFQGERGGKTLLRGTVIHVLYQCPGCWHRKQGHKQGWGCNEQQGPGPVLLSHLFLHTQKGKPGIHWQPNTLV